MPWWHLKNRNDNLQPPKNPRAKGIKMLNYFFGWQEQDTPETSTPTLSDHILIDDYEDLNTYTITRNNNRKATRWSDDDYAEMAATPFEISLPQQENSAGNEDQSLTDISDSTDQIPTIPTGHTRIQITQYENGKYVKGQSGNFEVKQDFEDLYRRLLPLKDLDWGQPKNMRVRVQLQNKVRGAMKGGANISIPRARVAEVVATIELLLGVE